MAPMPDEYASILLDDRPSQNFEPRSSRADLSTEITAAAAFVWLYLTVWLMTPVGGTDQLVFVAAIGALAIWRYGWMGLHMVRSHRYLTTTFPQLRAAERAEAQALKPSKIYVLITSYRIDHQTTFKVYDGLIRNAASYGMPTVIVSSLTDETDIDVLNHVMAHNGHPPNIELRCVFQKGDGKRSAMADALRSISRDLPSKDSVLVMMDGDILLADDVFDKSLGFFALEPDLGALTTNNRAIVEGNSWTREWYDLRYAQRHTIMSSLSCSRQLMVLTGRYSVFRGELALSRGFVDSIERDFVDHWRFGRFRFLSGDDKSSWFWVLKSGKKMRYLPDVMTYGFEALPDDKRWFASTTALMKRWYGNMLRASGRAIALGPRHMGFFLWWSLIDQRLSMWTTLIGPTTAIMLSIAHHPGFLATYLCWIMTVRLFAVCMTGMQHGRMSATWPFLLYYSQLWGALLKTYVSFRVNQQKWTRQNISAGEPESPWLRSLQRASSHAIHLGSVSIFVLALGAVTGALAKPNLATAVLFIGMFRP